MKRIILVVVLIGVAGIAGIVRSYSKAGGRIEWPQAIKAQSPSGAEARDEIRKSYELAPGARVEVSGINGAVTIETSDSRTAEVYVERKAASQEALNRRKIVIDSTPNSLTIRGEKGDGSFLGRIFGSNPTERVTLRLPREVSVATKGVNGAVKIGEIDGPVEVSGINGRVDVGRASGSARFSGINGSITVALRELGKGGVEISGINGSIELRLGEGVNADLDAHGMNGRVISELPNVVVDKSSRGNYTARIGSGGNSISASGINGNIRLTGMAGESKLAAN